MKDYMTVDEICEYFSIVNSTLDDWRKKGLVPTKVGKRVYFSASDINDFMKSFRVCEYQRSRKR